MDCFERRALSKIKVRMRFHRLIAVLVVLTGFSAVAQTNLASLFSNVTRTAAVPRRPSIIVIQAHDLALGDLSCYGQTNHQTPNLDRLAREGMRFTNYSGGMASPQTTAMLLAGQAGAAMPGEQNLARLLKANGYRTGLVGEWTFSRQPWVDGFDEFGGFFTDEEARDYYAPEIWRYPHVTLDESNRVNGAFLDKGRVYPNTGGNKGQWLPDFLFKAANNFVRIAQPGPANRWRPFFLLVNLPAPRSATPGRDDFPVPSDAPFTGEPWPQAAKNRAAMLTRLDGSIGRMFEQLETLGLTNNIAIFFTSSSAPEKFANTNLNFLLPKDNFRDTNNPAPPRLPMIVKFPGKIPAGEVSGLKWTAADVAPTTLELAYVRPATNFTGRSVLPALRGERKKEKP
jgi:arylsulfatase A-like enzyme